MESSIEGVCFLEICDMRIFFSTSCFNVCRSDPHFVLWYSRRKNFASYLISTNVDLWQVRIKVLFYFKLRDYHFLWAYFFKRASDWIQGVRFFIEEKYLIVRIVRNSHSQVLKKLLNGGKLYEIHFLGILKNI